MKHGEDRVAASEVLRQGNMCTANPAVGVQGPFDPGSVDSVAGSPSQSAAEPILMLESVSKSFPGQTALNGVSLSLRPGMIHALVGQNGAGKSTLIKILSGYYQPDPNALGVIGGNPFPFGAAAAIHEAGVRFVHQDLGLINSLSIADNYFLASSYGSRWVSHRRSARELGAKLSRYGLDASPSTLVGSLTQGQKSLLAIARCLGDLADARVLVLDEPTAALPNRDAVHLLETLRQIAAKDVAILYVSHNLGEVLSLAESVTVLRDGVVVACQSAGDLTVDSFAHLIAGRAVETIRASHTASSVSARSATAHPVLRARQLSGLVVDNVDLDIYRGEIVGIAGLPNSGRDEFPYLLAGSTPALGGSVELDGTSAGQLTPRACLQRGIVLVPADRLRQGGFPALTARENLTVPRSRRIPNRAWVTASRQRSETLSWMQNIGVEPPRTERPFRLFSGGNQQKLCIARALRLRPTVLILDEPAQGVDVAAKANIFRRIIDEARQRNMIVIVASSDPEDLAALCDRSLIMKNGKIVTELVGKDNTGARILAKMAG